MRRAPSGRSELSFYHYHFSGRSQLLFHHYHFSAPPLGGQNCHFTTVALFLDCVVTIAILILEVIILSNLVVQIQDI